MFAKLGQHIWKLREALKLTKDYTDGKFYEFMTSTACCQKEQHLRCFLVSAFSVLSPSPKCGLVYGSRFFNTTLFPPKQHSP